MNVRVWPLYLPKECKCGGRFKYIRSGEIRPVTKPGIYFCCKCLIRYNANKWFE